LPSTWASKSEDYRQTAATKFSFNFEDWPYGETFIAKFAVKAVVRSCHALEVDDHIRCADDGVVLVRRDAEIRIAVERKRIERLVVRNLGPDLDLRRKPVLPADCGLDVPRLGAGALALHIINKLGAIGEIVERRHLVIQIREIGLERCGTADPDLLRRVDGSRLA
jgi:hypothetical protein